MMVKWSHYCSHCYADNTKADLSLQNSSTNRTAHPAVFSPAQKNRNQFWPHGATLQDKLWGSQEHLENPPVHFTLSINIKVWGFPPEMLNKKTKADQQKAEKLGAAIRVKNLQACLTPQTRPTCSKYPHLYLQTSLQSCPLKDRPSWKFWLLRSTLQQNDCTCSSFLKTL